MRHTWVDIGRLVELPPAHALCLRTLCATFDSFFEVGEAISLEAR